MPSRIGEWISGSSLPSWDDMSPERFEEMVLGVVAAWLVGGVITAWTYVIEAILAVAESIRYVGRSLESALIPLGQIFQSIPYLVLDPFNDVILIVAASTGPLAPVAVVALWTASFVALLYVIRLMIVVAIRVFPFA